MIGTMRSVSVTRPSASHASSTASMSAMSAIEQPAFRSGRRTCWCGAGQDVGRLGHEVDAAEHDVLGVAALGRDPREPEGVAPDVGPAHHVVALVVVAEDQEPGPEPFLGGTDPVGQFLRSRAGVALR